MLKKWIPESCVVETPAVGSMNVTLFSCRHVVLPKELSKLVPSSHLMSEDEWRGLGVQQSQGWMHYMIHNPGWYLQNRTLKVMLNVLLFARLMLTGLPPVLWSSQNHTFCSSEDLCRRPEQEPPVKLLSLLLISVVWSRHSLLRVFVLTFVYFLCLNLKRQIVWFHCEYESKGSLYIWMFFMIWACLIWDYIQAHVVCFWPTLFSRCDFQLFFEDMLLL